jgi:glutathione S-transferase
MRLYFNKFSRATRPRWLIEEAGIPCEIVSVDMQAGEHRTEAYRRIHPHNRLPSLQDGDVTLMESAAICMYLADKAPESGLAPAVGTPERGLWYQWCVYGPVTLEPSVYRWFQETRKPEGERDAAAMEAAKRDFGACARVLADALSGRDWLVADRFSAADVVIGSIVVWAQRMGLCEGYPDIEAYAARCAERPAFRRARQ